MTKTFACSRGHRWQPNDTMAVVGVTRLDVCPQCGLPPVTENADLLASSATVDPDKAEDLALQTKLAAAGSERSMTAPHGAHHHLPTEELSQGSHVASANPPTPAHHLPTEEIGTHADGPVSREHKPDHHLATEHIGAHRQAATSPAFAPDGKTGEYIPSVLPADEARAASQATTDVDGENGSPRKAGEATVDRTDAGSVFSDRPQAKRGDQIVPGYEILKELGRGAMGVVYKARQKALNRLVALKMVLAGQHASERILTRFQIEAEAVARLHHPNIVQIYEIGKTDGCPFFSLEFVDGGTLAERVATQPLPPREAGWVVQQLGRAMDSAHRCGVLHRDLKPENVLLTRGPVDGNGAAAPVTLCVPKVTDFGLAKQLESDSGQTHAGTIMGTPSYMAPEQAEGRIEDVGPSADIYALGAILYDLLTGRPPFQGSTVLETLDQVKKLEPTPPRRFSSSVPLDLDTICLKCLEKDPAKRYASAGDLSDDLGRFLNGEPIAARPTPFWERAIKWCRRRPGAASVVGASTALLIALVVGGIWFTQHEHARAEEEGRLRQAAVEQRKIAEVKTADEEKQRKIAEVKTAGEAKQRKIAEAKTADEEKQRKIAEAKTADEAAQRKIAETKTADEAKQRKRAEEKTEEAIRERKKADDQRKLAESNFLEAEAAVDVLLTRISQQRLEGEPRMEQLRRDLLEEALRFYDRFLTQKGDDPQVQWQTGKANKKVGDIRRLQGDDTRAEEAYRTSLKLYEALSKTLQDQDRSAGSVVSLTKVQHDQAAAWNSLGQLLADQARQQDADDAYARASHLLEQLVAASDLPQYRQELAVSCHNRGLGAQRAGKKDQAENLLQKALDLQQKLAKELSGPKPPTADPVAISQVGREMARTLVSLGQFYQEQNEPDKGVKYVKLSLPVYDELSKGAGGRNPNLRQEAAFAHRRLGLLLQNSDRAQAEAEFRQAMKDGESLRADYPTVPDFRQDLAASVNNLAVLLLDEGKSKEADEEFKRSLALRVKLADDFPRKPDYRRDLANSYNDYGLMLQTKNRLSNSLTEYGMAVQVMEELVDKFSNVPDYEQKLAQFRVNQATVLQVTGKPAEAEKLYKQALARADLLVQLKADLPPEQQFEGARALYLLATWLQTTLPRDSKAQKEQLAKAEQFHGKARQQFRKLADTYPDQADYRSLLVDALNNLGDLLRATNRLDEALKTWQEGSLVAAGLVKEHAKQPAYAQKQARLLHNRGVVLSGQGKVKEAEECHHQAVSIRERLVRENKDEPGYVQELASSHGELAILLAKKNLLEDSAESFRKAVTLLQELNDKHANRPDFLLDELDQQNNLAKVLGALGLQQEIKDRGKRVGELKEKLAKLGVKP